MNLKESVLSGTYLIPLRTHKPPTDGHMRTELEVRLFLSLLLSANLLAAIHVPFSDQDGAL